LIWVNSFHYCSAWRETLQIDYPFVLHALQQTQRIRAETWVIGLPKLNAVAAPANRSAEPSRPAIRAAPSAGRLREK